MNASRGRQGRFALALAVAAAGAWYAGERVGRDTVPGTADSAAAEVIERRWHGAAGPTASLPPPESVRVELPAGTFGEQFEALRRLAEAGSGEAARLLYDGLEKCRGVPAAGDQNALLDTAARHADVQLQLVDQVVQKAKDAAAARGGALVMPEVPTGAVFEEALHQLRERAVECEGAPRFDIDASMALLERAAILGDADAQLRYANESLRSTGGSISVAAEAARRKPLVRDMLAHSLKHGDWRALAVLGDMLSIGYFTDPDPAAAYAYFYAARQAPDASGSRLPWASGPTLMFFGDAAAELDADMARLAARLTPEEITLAQGAGLALYTRCCMGKARAVLGSEVPADVATPEQVRESARIRLRERRELCVSMMPADFARRLRWFEILATSSDTKTVLELTGRDRPFDQVEIVRHAETFARISRTFRDNFERLAASGNREALHRGRFVYGRGGWLAPPDPVRAYAFSYASARFPGENFASNPQELASEAARLTPDQLAEGMRQGEILLRQCCHP